MKKQHGNIGRKLSRKHREKISLANKGKPSWNKGIPRYWESPTEFKKGQNADEKHYFWKGDGVSYRSLHRWIERKLGKAIKCSKCGAERKGKNIHWSNNDHKYRRNVEDWTQLCVSCHKEYDKMLRGKKKR